ncbi:protein FAM161B [Pelodytes ibericus]
MDWQNEGPKMRFGRLMDFVDQEDAESDNDLHVKLQELKLKNSLHLQDLSSLYQASCKNGSLPHMDHELEDLFFTSHVCNQNPRQEKGFKKTPQRPKTSSTRHDFSATVPQPFQMSLREAERQDKRRELDFSDSLALRDQEDPECLKQFRAQPVPAQVFLSLYNDLVEQQEAKRKSAMEKRKEFLLSTQKPFRFISKEEEKRKRMSQRPMTAPSVKAQIIKRDIPKCVLDPQFSDKLKEAEVVRKIKSQMRAKDMLQNSSAPIPLTRGTRDPNSRTSQKTQQEYLSFLQENLSFHPHTNPTVPDFQKLYWKFQKQSLENRIERAPTQNKPFRLQTSNLRVRKQSNTESVEDIDHHSEAPSKYLQGLLSLSPNTLPVYITDSTKRRDSAIRASLEDKDKHEIEMTRWTRKQSKKIQAMQKSICRRAKALDRHQPLADVHGDKLKQIRQADLRRMKEYNEELEQMKTRVKNRPFLFEHVTKGNAIKEVERKFTSTLEQAGLTEEFVQTKGKAQQENYITKSSEDEEKEMWEEEE